MRNTIFISYSHSDERWLKRLRVHLKPLERQGVVDPWDSHRIEAGEKWRSEIKKAIDAAAVAILLVSADFLASDFITEDELPPLLRAADDKGTVILPVLISPSRFAQTELSKFQAFKPLSDTLIGMSKVEREETFLAIANRVEQLLKPSAKPKTLTKESIEEELVEEGVFHPTRAAGARGELHDCQFYTSPFYQKTKLWEVLADVLVVLREPAAIPGDVYLIPSGLANPHLSDARFLRSDEGRTWLERKREATIEFVKRGSNRVLDGRWFIMNTRTGKRTKVYSAEYDECLTDATNDLAAPS